MLLLSTSGYLHTDDFMEHLIRMGKRPATDRLFFFDPDIQIPANNLIPLKTQLS